MVKRGKYQQEEDEDRNIIETNKEEGRTGQSKCRANNIRITVKQAKEYEERRIV